jgi:hypothetical protein
MIIRVSCAILLTLCCLGQTPARPWTYRMEGNLDHANLRCNGASDVTLHTGSDSRQCIAWRIREQKCTGSKDADWLHRNDPSGEICRDGTGEDWQMTKSLPGRAVCDPSVKFENGRLAELTISCTWECRGSQDPCEGAASYQFSPPSPR